MPRSHRGMIFPVTAGTQPMYRITGHYLVVLLVGWPDDAAVKGNGLCPYPGVADAGVGDDDVRLLRYGAI